MMRDLNETRIKKTDHELIKTLIKDTNDSKLHWYHDDDYIYTRRIKFYDKSKSELIFKISDEEYDDDNAYFEFPEMFKEMLITLDIYMKKNNKEIFCKRITSEQLLLSELINVILPVMKKKPNIT